MISQNVLPQISSIRLSKISFETIKSKIIDFENSGIKSDILLLIEELLSCVPPTSVIC